MSYEKMSQEYKVLSCIKDYYKNLKQIQINEGFFTTIVINNERRQLMENKQYYSWYF